MKFKYEGDDHRIHTAISRANRFLSEVNLASVPNTPLKFSSLPFAHDVLKRVKHLYKAHDHVVVVKTYRPRWRFSKAIAMTYGRDIAFNQYKVSSLSVSDMVGTLVHELVHICDSFDTSDYYNHGTNTWTVEKQNQSAPYLIGTFTSKFAEDCVD
jgi:predicted metallopeptidase